MERTNATVEDVRKWEANSRQTQDQSSLSDVSNLSLASSIASLNGKVDEAVEEMREIVQKVNACNIPELSKSVEQTAKSVAKQQTTIESILQAQSKFQAQLQTSNKLLNHRVDNTNSALIQFSNIFFNSISDQVINKTVVKQQQEAVNNNFLSFNGSATAAIAAMAMVIIISTIPVVTEPGKTDRPRGTNKHKHGQKSCSIVIVSNIYIYNKSFY